MANTYFQFKQFRIDQNLCAMKVCTDACILGAWFSRSTKQYKHVLDIGSGTGLLMLMIAQKSEARIHGVEIEEGCFTQLNENLSGSEWSPRLKAIHGDVRTFMFDQRFDFIISNPPFYEDDLVSPSTNKQLAMHSKELKFDELAVSVARNLEPNGQFGILLPYHRADAFRSTAEKHGLQLVHELKIRQTPGHTWFRSVATYRHSGAVSSAGGAGSLAFSELSIRDGSGHYSAAFVELMEDYYLHL